MENLEQFVRDEAQAAAQAAVASAMEETRKQEKRQGRKKVRKVALYCTVAAGLVCTGFMIGVHRKVIKAYLTGGPMPELPEGHPRFCCMNAE